MTNDKDIERLFSTSKREFSDNGEMIDRLSGGLDMIDRLKRETEKERRSYIIGVVSTLVSGLFFEWLITSSFRPNDLFTYLVAGIAGIAAILIALNIQGIAMMAGKRR
ncbi:MAG: hypothetical protein MJY89_08545 [Bacteroidales bacterium]|nr:hypothetical protein [Bacteroidales bacterium]